MIIDKKTGTKIYHWIDDYGRNEVKPFKEYKCKKENDVIRLEVIENPNYHGNESMSEIENTQKELEKS